MKNLANCTPSEFLRQTVKIKRAVEKWLTVTEVMEIRKRIPENIPAVTGDMTKGEREEAEKKKREAFEAQARRNLSEMFDSVMEEHPQETLEVLALCCFVDPAEVDSHPMTYYLTSVMEMAQDEAVQGFFSWLMRSGLTVTSNR